MFSIGDFSRLSRVSIKALRYYDEIGLFKPDHVDAENGYRYYAASQLSRLHRILILKELGLSLDQIIQVLNEGLSLIQLQAMLHLKQLEVQRNLEREQERLIQIKAWMKRLDQEEQMSGYDILVKNLESQLVASIRSKFPRYQDVGRVYPELCRYLAQYRVNSGIMVALWHDNGYKESDIDGEAVCYLKNPIPATERVQVYELPAGQVVSTIHHGSYATLSLAYDAILQWISTQPYQIVGPTREIYLYCDEPVRQDDDSYVTEVQFPIALKQ